VAASNLKVSYSAVSDVGRVRKDNQDSGYAGPWLLTMCDGVGGAARGDIASATAVGQLRRLDREPTDDVLASIAGALHRAHDRIAELVDQDAALTGTSTTAVVAVFDPGSDGDGGHGARFGVGHIGDSRAYLLRGGELRQVTKDHTFVQSLVDEGRITSSEAERHPHKNVILKALDAVQEVDADLFYLDVEPGDRLLICSDGVSDYLPRDTIQRLLGDGTPDYAAIELVRQSLEAGSRDNVTAVIGEIVPQDALPPDLEPLLVGSAAELPRKMVRATPARLFRGHRSGDTGEIEPVQADLALPPGAIITDPVDPEQARYAPQPAPNHPWLRRLFGLLMLLGLVGIGAGIAQHWIDQQFYVGERDGVVTVFRGLPGDLLGHDLSTPYETTNLHLDQLSDYDAGQVRDGSDSVSLERAREIVQSYYDRAEP